MTLGEGKRKVLELLDEYGETIDEDIEQKLPDLFDIAQKKVAQIARIIRIEQVEREEGVTAYALPEDCDKLIRIWKDGRNCRGYRMRAGELILEPEDTSVYEFEYAAIPETIGEETSDSYVFEVGENAAQCMPFFVAGEVLSSDMVNDPNIYLNMYQMMIMDLTTDAPGTGRLNQTFFRRRA